MLRRRSKGLLVGDVPRHQWLRWKELQGAEQNRIGREGKGNDRGMQTRGEE